MANADWASEPDMVRVGKLDVGIELWPLLRKQVVQPWIRVEKPVIHAERDSNGRNNWTFESPEKAGPEGQEREPMPLPKIGQLFGNRDEIAQVTQFHTPSIKS